MKKKPSSDKLRGGYYTPEIISRFLSEWAIQEGTQSILEPSCGDGNILTEIVRRAASACSEATVTGVELLPDEATKARRRARAVDATVSAKVIVGSFFDSASTWLSKSQRFDAIIGNPPFIRYQDFPEHEQTVSFDLMRRLNYNPSRLSNSWLPFLAIASGLLSDDGRLAMVIPSELFQVNYAADVRARMAELFSRITIISFEQLVFPDIQQEVVLLLAERGGRGRRGIQVCELRSADDLASFVLPSARKSEVKPVDQASEKWTKYFLSTSEILLLRELRQRTDIPMLGKFIDIDVGLVTGNNDFFAISNEVVKEWKIQGDCIPLVGRSAALPGIVFRQEDLEEWTANGKNAFLFYPSFPYSTSALRYIRHGESLDVDQGYKCRIRREWFIVPSVWKPDVFFLRQADLAPRLVANESGAMCTDTLHRGRLLNGVSGRLLSTSFINSLTFAASEVGGRSYGGGVMTFEPTEVERLPLPILDQNAVDVLEIDRLVRQKRLFDALDLVDRELLINGLSISKKDVESLRSIWVKLSTRRRARKTRPTSLSG